MEHREEDCGIAAQIERELKEELETGLHSKENIPTYFQTSRFINIKSWKVFIFN